MKWTNAKLHVPYLVIKHTQFGGEIKLEIDDMMVDKIRQLNHNLFA